MFASIPDVLPPGMYMVPCVLFQQLPNEIFSVLAAMPSESGNPMDSYAFCGLQVRYGIQITWVRYIHMHMMNWVCACDAVGGFRCGIGGDTYAQQCDKITKNCALKKR